MFPVSQAFKNAVRQAHVVTIRAEVWRPTDEVKLLDLEVLGGQVDIDSRRSVRRTCSLTVAAPDPVVEVRSLPGNYTYGQVAAQYVTYNVATATGKTYAVIALYGTADSVVVDAGIVPDTSSDALTPFGNEIRLWRGIRYDEARADLVGLLGESGAALLSESGAALADETSGTIVQTGGVEEVPLGVFVITSVDIQQTAQGTTVQVQGSDRSLRIQRARWTEPYQAAGVSVEAAIGAILSDRWADVTTSLDATSRTVARATFGTDSNSDPWADVGKLAEAAGFDLFFDGDGVARLTEIPDYENATPDATYAEGEDAVVLSVARGISVDDTFNGVIATGEGAELADTYRGEAWDEDDSSPTYRYGPFGQVPRFYSSPLITSNEQAQAAAEALLARGKGAVESISWTQVCDPALESGDVVALTNAATKVNTVLVLDRLTVPLDATRPMQAVARSIRTWVE